MSETRPIHVGVLFGGRSGEHEVSLRSARAVVDALDPQRYQVTLIGIDPEGGWHLLPHDTFAQLTRHDTLSALAVGDSDVILQPAPQHGQLLGPHSTQAALPQLDVLFPVLHGPYGEDGTVQGLFELADIPYVGAGVLGSAVGMDKDVQKRLLQEAGLPQVPFLVCRRLEWERDAAEVLARAMALGPILFVKPANLGSSVGISKVTRPDALPEAIRTAFAYDTKIIIEMGIDQAREIECAVLGNEEPEVSIAGEIRPHADFYSYEAKYIDESGAALIIPAELDAAQMTFVQEMAIQVFQILECSGLARVDFLLDPRTEQFYVNELNSLPGFTSISMYPKLWEASGRSYAELVDRLITLAMERHAQRRQLQHRYVAIKDG